MQEILVSKSSRTVVLLGSNSLASFRRSHKFHQHSLQAQRTQCAGLCAGPEPNSCINGYTDLQHRKYLHENLQSPGLRELIHSINIGICTYSEVVSLYFTLNFEGDTQYLIIYPQRILYLWYLLCAKLFTIKNTFNLCSPKLFWIKVLRVHLVENHRLLFLENTNIHFPKCLGLPYYCTVILHLYKVIFKTDNKN